MLEFQDYYLLKEINSIYPNFIKFQNGKIAINESICTKHGTSWI